MAKTKFIDVAGREAWRDEKGLVFTEGGKKPTFYNVSEWNKRQSERWGSKALSVDLETPSVEVPTRKEQVQPFLDAYQERLKVEREALKAPIRSEQEILKEVKTFLTPTSPVPEAPKLVELFQELRTDADIETIETQINDLRAQEEEAFARLRERRGIEEGKPVSLNVITGRVSEAERQEMERVDFIQRVKGRLVDELKTRYGLIDTIINLTNTDYNNALKTYQTEFNQNIAIYNAFRVTRKEEREEKLRKIKVARGERQVAEERVFELATTFMAWEREDLQRAEDTARSNLQIYSNLIAEGNLRWDDLPDVTRLEVGKLEVKAGLGVGFLANIRPDNPLGEIKSITTRQDASGMKHADIIRVDRDGRVSIQTTSLGPELLPKYVTEEEEKVKITPTLVRDAASIIEDIDENADQLLSKEESYNALLKVRSLVGDEQVGNELFDRAWSLGGYNKWRW